MSLRLAFTLFISGDSGHQRHCSVCKQMRRKFYCCAFGFFSFFLAIRQGRTSGMENTAKDSNEEIGPTTFWVSCGYVKDTEPSVLALSKSSFHMQMSYVFSNRIFQSAVPCAVIMEYEVNYIKCRFAHSLWQDKKKLSLITRM